MPGSPPISTTPPTFSPPPSTRSNSSMPLEKRGTSAASISDSLRTMADAASGWKRLDAAVSATVSTSVFHCWQCGHWPAQRGAVPPHSVQV
ncbi:hypothetical protein D9M69_433680 [compost metagenome]